jgi:hypothetical protein
MLGSSPSRHDVRPVVVSREEMAPVFTLVVAERIDLGRHLIV